MAWLLSDDVFIAGKPTWRGMNTISFLGSSLARKGLENIA